MVPVTLLVLVPGQVLAGAQPMRHLETSAKQIAAGQAIFALCGSCHDADGSGRAGMGPRLVSDSFLAAASDAFLIETIENGRAGSSMLAWGAMYNESQIASIVVYLRSLNPVAPAVLDETPLKGTASDGEPVFTGVCSSCHGRAGGGYQESANGTGIGRKAFLDTASNGFLRHLIRHGKSDTAMRPFSSEVTATAVMNLKDNQIDGVIAYLRANAW